MHGLTACQNAEHAIQPSERRADGAGLLMAESCKGISHGLHSKADQLFELAFRPGLLTANKLVMQVRIFFDAY